MTITVLDRELYDIRLAAGVLKMAPTTLEWWLEGGTRRGKRYDPVIRPEPTRSKTVTWGELVEARYLKAYRRDLGVGLSDIRHFVANTRDRLGVPYPLAHERPWVADRKLIIEAQESANLPEELWVMWQAKSGQIHPTPPAEYFLERVEFNDDIAVRLHPAGRESPIVIDPDIRFGTATIHGIPTEAVAEQVSAGDPIEMVAEDFGLHLSELVAVLSYELTAPEEPAA